MSAGGPASGDPADAPLCEAADLAVTVRWERDGTGLHGQVLAENVGGRVCRLAGKPAVTPLAGDGTPLPAGTVITLEWRSPGYVLLRPGQRAAARCLGPAGAGGRRPAGPGWAGRAAKPWPRYTGRPSRNARPGRRATWCRPGSS